MNIGAVIGVYALMSVVSFCLYGLDKAAARKNKSRIPEARLHWFALFGGWPGAWLGQKVFHHKTIKTRFRVVFWLTCGANLVFLLLGLFFAHIGWKATLAVFQQVFAS